MLLNLIEHLLEFFFCFVFSFDFQELVRLLFFFDDLSHRVLLFLVLRHVKLVLVLFQLLLEFELRPLPDHGLLQLSHFHVALLAADQLVKLRQLLLLL